MIYIGIDTGTHTGVAIWDAKYKLFVDITTLKIDEAFEIILLYKEAEKDDIFVKFEDARLRKWYGNSGREKLQGAGSIKRDCVIWEDFLKRKKIQYKAVPPKNNTTKLSKEAFMNITKYEGITSEHSRDAAMLVFGI